jgi:DNA-binding MarR family transcriptional regulator
MARIDRPERAVGRRGEQVPGSDGLEFADALLAFLAAARRTRGRMQPLFDDITVPQLVLLDAIEEVGRDGVRAVADYTSLSQPTVTRSAAVLERDGLVWRTAADGDGRRRVLGLTSRGERLLAEKRSIVARQFAGAWDRLTPAERSLAVPLLRHLSRLVDELF